MASRAARRRAPKAVKVTNGPWVGVVTTDDPFDSGDDKLLDASNGYIPDIQSRSGFYARPGMNLLNDGDQIDPGVSPFRGQGVISHTNLDGETFNFVVFGGKLYREDAVFSAATDVTPAGITIDASATTRVYSQSFANQLVITDGVNRPWLATDLSATPITGTYIDFDGTGTDWAAFGRPTLYAGAFFFILSQFDGVSARTDIAWSAPGDAAVGYQQSGYDFRWTLGQTDAEPLTAIFGTNTQLVYWRENSIGAIAGVPGPNLQTSHTDDAISKNVGTLAPQSIVAYGTTIFFTDAVGRPYRLVPGVDPEPIWKQMRGIIQDTTVGFSGVTKTVTCAAAEATMRAYIVAIWSPIPSQQCPAVEGYIFDLETGRYFGRFSIAAGVQLEAMGSFLDSNGRSTMVVLGSLVPPDDSSLAPSGYVWGIKSLEAVGDFLTTEDGVFLTTEDGVLLTTEGSESANWMDGDVVPSIYATTPRFGYEIDQVGTVDRVAALMGGGSAVNVSVLTAAVAFTVEGTPTPIATEDNVGRVIVGCDGIQGRGATIKVQPTTAQTQWQLQQVSLDVVLNRSNPDEDGQ